MYNFNEHEQMILFFFSVVYELGQYICVSLVAREIIQIQCTCADVDTSNALSFGSCIGRASTSGQVHWI